MGFWGAIGGGGGGSSSFVSFSFPIWNLASTGPVFEVIGITSNSTVEANRQNITAVDLATMRNYVCTIQTNTRSVEVVRIVRIQLADGNQTVTIPASTTGRFSDNVNTDSMSQFDEFSIRTNAGVGSGQINPRNWSCEWLA